MTNIKEAGLDAWKHVTPQQIRLGRSTDQAMAIHEMEAMIARVSEANGREAAVWAARVVLALSYAVPAAWLTLLKNGEHTRQEFMRLLECARAACDFAYGPEFNIPTVADKHFVEAMDTFIELKQFEAAMYEKIGDNEQAELLRSIALQRFTNGSVPEALLQQSKTLKPV